MLVGYNKLTEELARQTVTEPFYTISDLAAKIHKAEKNIQAGQIPPGCEDFPCPYVFLHSPKEEPEPADPELDGLLSAWVEADKNEKIYARERDILKEAIKEYVGEEGVGKIRGSQGVTVSTKWMEEKVVNYTVAPHWETRVQGPRKKGGDGD